MSLDKREITIIEEELHAAINKLIKGCEVLDMKLAFEIFHDSPEFLMIGTGGTLNNYQTYLKNNIDYLKNCQSFKLTTYNRNVHIFDNNTAVYSWAYGVKSILKSGEIDTIEKAGASFFFRKIQNSWKVVYYHESSEPLKRVIKV